MGQVRKEFGCTFTIPATGKTKRRKLESWTQRSSPLFAQHELEAGLCGLQAARHGHPAAGSLKALDIDPSNQLVRLPAWPRCAELGWVLNKQTRRDSGQSCVVSRRDQLDSLTPPPTTPHLGLVCGIVPCNNGSWGRFRGERTKGFPPTNRSPQPLPTRCHQIRREDFRVQWEPQLEQWLESNKPTGDLICRPS